MFLDSRCSKMLPVLDLILCNDHCTWYLDEAGDVPSVARLGGFASRMRRKRAAPAAFEASPTQACASFFSLIGVLDSTHVILLVFFSSNPTMTLRWRSSRRFGTVCGKGVAAYRTAAGRQNLTRGSGERRARSCSPKPSLSFSTAAPPKCPSGLQRNGPPIIACLWKRSYLAENSV